MTAVFSKPCVRHVHPTARSLVIDLGAISEQVNDIAKLRKLVDG